MLRSTVFHPQNESLNEKNIFKNVLSILEFKNTFKIQIYL